jgi:signal transduction histidine kinase
LAQPLPGPGPAPTGLQVALALGLVLAAIGINFAVPQLAAVSHFLTLYLGLALVAWLVPFRRVLYPLVLGSAAFTNWAFFSSERHFALDWPSLLATLAFVLVQGVLGTLIIERTRMTERLARRNEELAAAAEFETRLRDMVSHDIRNPVASIRLGIEVLLRRGPDASDRDVLERMDRSAERTQKLAQALLDVARLRSGQALPLDPVPTDLVPLVQHLVAELPGSERVRLMLPESVAGTWDPDRLSQAISNLVGNALQHSPDGSPVRVTVSAMPDEARVEVHNLGAPIESRLVPYLFVPFGSLRAGPGKKESVGLGLFITRSVAEAHGGRLELASSSGRGTTFVLHLPRVNTEARPGAEPRPPARV